MDDKFLSEGRTSEVKSLHLKHSNEAVYDESSHFKTESNVGCKEEIKNRYDDFCHSQFKLKNLTSQNFLPRDEVKPNQDINVNHLLVPWIPKDLEKKYPEINHSFSIDSTGKDTIFKQPNLTLKTCSEQILKYFSNSKLLDKDEVDNPCHQTIACSKINMFNLKGLKKNQSDDCSLDINEESLSTIFKKFKEKYEIFFIVYLNWKKSRIEAIKKLNILQQNVHSDQLKYNKANAVFKNLNVRSRQLKMNYKSTPVSFLSSFTTLVTDAVSGFTSVAQAVNIDSHLKAFSEIMYEDMMVTKQFYEARSTYFEQYKDVEEVCRKYHSETFINTLNNISAVLNTEKLWSDIQLIIERDEMSEIFNSVNKFINYNVSNGAVVKAYDTFQDYADKNPAALAAFNSAGKVVCDVYDSFNLNPDTMINFSEKSVGELLLSNELSELSELQSVIEKEDNNQIKLESDIQDAIVGFQREIEEVDNFLKKIHI